MTYPSLVSLTFIFYFTYLPANPGVLGEEPSECSFRWFRNFREFHSPQRSKKDSLQFPFIRKTEMADPLILDLNREYVLKHRPKPTPRPIELIRMMKPSSQAKYLPPPPIAGLAEDSSLHDGSEELDEPEFVEPQTEGLATLMDMLAAEADGDDDDDILFITDDPNSENEEKNSSKRRRTV